MPDGTNPIKLGIVVKDKVTGFTGMAIKRAEALYDTPIVLVQPRGGGYRKADDAQWIKEAQLEVVAPVAQKQQASKPAQKTEEKKL